MEIGEMIVKYGLRLVREKGEVGILPLQKLTKKEREEVIKHKEEIKAELLRREEEEKSKEAEEKARLEEEIKRIKKGEKKIKVKFKDGEYLSGYTVTGDKWEEIDAVRKMLEELGVVKWVSGWGYIVSEEMVRELGEEFTYPQVLEYLRPLREEKARKEAERQAKFEEAKRTGKPVELSRIAVECNDPDEECDIDIITVYAMPDGSIKEKREHTW